MIHLTLYQVITISTINNVRMSSLYRNYSSDTVASNNNIHDLSNFQIYLQHLIKLILCNRSSARRLAQTLEATWNALHILMTSLGIIFSHIKLIYKASSAIKCGFRAVFATLSCAMLY